MDALNKKADVNSHNKEDLTTLQIAVNEGHYNVAEVLLEN